MQFRYPGPSNHPLFFKPAHPQLCGALAFQTQTDSGEIFFDHIPGQGFDVWFGRYRFSRPTTLYFVPEDGMIEFWCHYKSKFMVYSECSGMLSGRYKQYQLSRIHQLPRLAEFSGPGEYDCFTIRFNPSMLEPYATHCPTLSDFLQQRGPLGQEGITDKPCFLTPRMDAIITDMLCYELPAGLASQFYSVH